MPESEPSLQSDSPRPEELRKAYKHLARKFHPDESQRYPLTISKLDADGFKHLGSEYIERTRQHRGDRVMFTDKHPNNFAHVGLLHLILPNAKIINARRAKGRKRLTA